MEETDNMNTHNNNEEIIHEQQENDTITGVHENEQNNSTNDDNTPEHDPENTHDCAQTTPEEEKKSIGQIRDNRRHKHHIRNECEQQRG